MKELLSKTSFDIRRRVKIVEETSAPGPSGSPSLISLAEAAARVLKDTRAEDRLTGLETALTALKQHPSGGHGALQGAAIHFAVEWAEQEGVPAEPKLASEESEIKKYAVSFSNTRHPP